MGLRDIKAQTAEKWEDNFDSFPEPNLTIIYLFGHKPDVDLNSRTLESWLKEKQKQKKQKKQKLRALFKARLCLLISQSTKVCLEFDLQ